MQPRDKKGRFIKKPLNNPHEIEIIEVFEDNSFDLILIGNFTLENFKSFSKKEGGVYVTQLAKK